MNCFLKKALSLGLFFCLIYVQASAQQEVKLYKLKSVLGSNENYKASNLVWEENGTETSMFDKAGGRTIILSFWGSWCPYCIRHLPELAKLYDFLPKDKYYFINAVSENGAEDVEAARKALIENEVYFDNVWYLFSDSNIMQVHYYYNITQFISTVIINPGKKVTKEVHDVIYQDFLDTLGNMTGTGEEYNLYANVKIYPNPVNSTAILSFNIDIPCKTTVKLFNTLGIEISSQSIEEISAGMNYHIIDCAELTSGMYYYTVTAGSAAYGSKFTVVK